MANAAIASEPSPAAADFVNTVAPQVSGDAMAGQTLYASSQWDPSPSKVEFQWLRTASGVTSKIDGATYSQYTLTDSDVGYRHSVEVSAYSPDWFDQEPRVMTSPTHLVVRAAGEEAPPVVNVRQPTILGTFRAGQTLTAEVGLWEGAPANPDFRYNWFVIQPNGDSGNFSQASTFTLTEAMAGSTIRLRVEVYYWGRIYAAESLRSTKVLGENEVEPPVTPTDPPVKPTEPPVVPTDPPVKPTEPPVTPTDPPVKPTEPPVTPTDPPVKPTEPPVVPTDPPVKPTEPPVVPTDPPVKPTEPPVTPTDPPVTPDAPFQDDSGLVEANQGGLTVSTSGDHVAVITLGADAKNDKFFVFGYSTPVALGEFVADEDGNLTVAYGQLGAGEHSLAVVEADGTLIGWVPVTVDAAVTPPVGVKPVVPASPEPTVTDALPSTGFDTTVPLVAGGLLLLAGGLLGAVARRRRAATS